jgi:hypothetical protein
MFCTYLGSTPLVRLLTVIAVATPFADATRCRSMPVDQQEDAPPLLELHAALNANGGQLERLGSMMEEMLTQVV